MSIAKPEIETMNVALIESYYSSSSLSNNIICLLLALFESRMGLVGPVAFLSSKFSERRDFIGTRPNFRSLIRRSGMVQIRKMVVFRAEP